MRVSEMSNRQLEDELRDIEDRLRSRNLTRREEDELIRDRDTLLDELDYRDRDSRRNQPRENSYGGGCSPSFPSPQGTLSEAPGSIAYCQALHH